MKDSLAESLGVLVPHLSPDLADQATWAELRALARRLPPIARGGFECHLGREARRVDLQQCIRRINSEPNRLWNHIRSLAPPREDPASSAWSRLEAYLRQWASGSLGDAIFETWLEFDQPLFAELSVPPSLFFGLNPSLVGSSSRFDVAEQSLDVLLGASCWADWKANLYRCFAACPERVFVSHIGVMLSRAASALRVNVKRLLPETLPAYLHQMGWPGDTENVASLMDELYRLVDRITVCLDVGTRLSSKLGFECILHEQPQHEERWAALLTYLLEHGMCTPSKRAALLDWPGVTTPTHAVAPWPGHLVLESLLQPAHSFTSIERQLSHIKVVYHPGQPLEAKGYLWFSHRWLQVDPPSAYELPFIENDPRLAESDRDATYLEQVRAYYDMAHEAYLAHVGSTIQSSLVTFDGSEDDARAHNVHLATRAGIRPGYRILDAGCGVCGPALDIAQAIADVTIDGITLSPVQARAAQERIQQCALEDRVRVHVGDYHTVPFPDATFEVVVFFESAGYSYSPQALFAEMFRVLKPGGCLYLKDVFVRSRKLSAAEKRERDIFNQIYAYRTTSLAEATAVIASSGFEEVTYHNLSTEVSGKHWQQAMGEEPHGRSGLTAFGKLHYYSFQSLPIITGEIKARKPGDLVA